MNNWLVFILIYLIIPTVGIITYFIIVQKMKNREVPELPEVELFFVFGTYGILLIIILVDFFSLWSGLASIATFSAVTLGPILMLITARKTFHKRKLTIYHNIIFLLSISYILIIVILIISLFVLALSR